MQFLKPTPSTVIADTPTVKCAMAELAPGGEYSLHNHPGSDEVYIFLSGEGEIVAPGSEQVERFTAPMQAYIPAGTSYALKNVGEQPLKLVWALCPKETSEMRTLPAPAEQAPVVMLGTDNGERFPNSEKIRGGMLTFQPNTECGYHSHDGADEVFFFLSGTGEVTEEGEVVRVGPGDVVVTPAEHKHKIKSFDEPLVMWLTVTPNRVPSHTHYKELADGTWERITPRQ
ncbi:MAG: dimethylsulfonioproprionate lyase family protein [Candidatus Poribacteria bacterium]|nr:dimethylsulfonioproprionate lyase family protein [Candidatus Poribacteria bacterium]